MGITQVAVGYYHAVAIDDQRRLWGWGSNDYDQLGPSLSTPRSFVPAILREDAVTVLTGASHTVVLTTSGQVITSGYNGSGQLSIGTVLPVHNWTASSMTADMIRVATTAPSRAKSARSIAQDSASL